MPAKHNPSPDQQWSLITDTIARSHIEHAIVSNGNAILIHAPCENILGVLPASCIDLVVTDPPYGQAYRTNHRVAKRDKHLLAKLTNDDQLQITMLRRIISQLCVKVKPRGAIYWFTDDAHIGEVRSILSDSFAHIGPTLIWVKNNWSAGNLNGYAVRTEYILFATPTTMHRMNGGRDHNVLYFSRVSGNGMIHPTEKPLSLIEYIIQRSSASGDTVLDPFMGSGTSVQAAVLNGRRAIGIEVDPAHYHNAINRMQQLVIPVDQQPVQPPFETLFLTP